jgi:regulator of protease activity HflC (stomatin/prohibitin superfamily)
VDAPVYFKVKSDETSVKAATCNEFNYQSQIVNLARTTLKSANREPQRTLRDQTGSWGIEIVRTEFKEIDPPKDVQETMNKVVKAENEKTVADGARRAEIKKVEGVRQEPGSSRPRARSGRSSS